MSSPPAISESSPSRWAVILVRLPEDPEALHEVLPRSQPVQPEDLPLVTRVTKDLHKARRTASRLRKTGAQVVVVEEPVERGHSAFCTTHPAQLAARNCETCETAICPGCMVDAHGHPLCAQCHLIKAQRTRSTRRRQLFMALLFTLFLYQVVDYLRADQAKVAGSGPVKVGIIQFAPHDHLSAPIIRALNQGPDPGLKHPTLRDLAPWYNAEHKRYTGMPGPYLDVQSRGPFPMDVQAPTLSQAGDSWYQAMFRAWQYPRYFKRMSEGLGVPVDDYGIKVYVVYGAGDRDLASHSRGSEKGRVAVVFISVEEVNPAYALTTMAHEIGHALGAMDTYDPVTNLAVHPTGYVQPFADPLYPQRFAEVMAVDIPLSPTEEFEVTSLDRLKVGYETAAGMGWIGPEQAKLFNTPPALSPAQRLDGSKLEPAQ
jgi:hypothetical protein